MKKKDIDLAHAIRAVVLPDDFYESRRQEIVEFKNAIDVAVKDSAEMKNLQSKVVDKVKICLSLQKTSLTKQDEIDFSNKVGSLMSEGFVKSLVEDIEPPTIYEDEAAFVERGKKILRKKLYDLFKKNSSDLLDF